MPALRQRRMNHEIRPMQFGFELGKHADGACVARFGETVVLCTARIERRVPPHVRGTGAGWLSAEYAMLPNATGNRIGRMKSLEGGRAKEISRLIGRSLRAVCHLDNLGERQILIDCDVLHADGGTRTTAINGSFIALYRALQTIDRAESVLHDSLAAISCVLIDGKLRVDPDYREDFAADADANFVFSGSGGLIEAQATAESRPIAANHLSEMLQLAGAACRKINQEQARVLGLDEEGFLDRSR